MDELTPENKSRPDNATAQSYHVQVEGAGDGGENTVAQGAGAVALGRQAIYVGGDVRGSIYQGLTIEEVAALVAELKRVEQPQVWDGRIPYLGLSAYRESDAQFFFGRESLVDDLLERVQTASFIVLAGPSGSGKSSVARAGLFHALRQGRLERSDSWLLATMTPAGNPIEQLAAAVARSAKSPTAGAHIRQRGLENGLALYEQIQTLLTDDARQRFVLLVDQFEEIFTPNKEEAARVAFINLLTSAAEVTDGRAIILVALRSDFVSHCARYPDLREQMSRQFQLVGAMEAHDLAKAITLPALEVGAGIDPALVSRILADMKGEPGALPLMSFALRDLFEAEKTKKGQPMDMTLKEYMDRGGIERALEQHANRVFASFSEEQQELAKSVFSRLIEVGQGRVDTRRTVVLAELVPTGQEVDAVAAVVDRLARGEARLLTTGSGYDDETGTAVTVTIAHEKLIDAWPWLRRLVDDNREAIALQNQITNDAQAWGQAKDAGYLYRGGRLVQVEEKLGELGPNLNEQSWQFIQASLDAKEAEKQAEAERIQKEETLRIGWLTVGGGVGAGLGLALLRSLLAGLMGEPGGYLLFSYFPSGFLLGATVSLSLLLVDSIWLKPSAQLPKAQTKRPLAPALVVGSLSFALVHLLLFLLLDWRSILSAPLVPFMAIVAGLGLSLAVYDQPQAGWRLGFIGWPLRLVAGSAAFVLVQTVFVLLPEWGTQLIFGWSGFFYQSRLADNLVHWGLEGILAWPQWFHLAALLDAFLTGIVLCLGLMAGLIIAARHTR